MKRLGIYDMGKDIDRNITRQLFEKNKNSFTRNDVIPVENGGTGVTNIKDIVSLISNGTKYIKRINNTYKNEKIDKIVSSYIDINNNSMYLNMLGNYTVTGYEINTPLILAVFPNTGFMPNVRCSAMFGNSNNVYSTITLYDGTITISVESPVDIRSINGAGFRNFFSFPL